MIVRVLVGCLLLLASLAYAAEEPDMQDFAQANPIETDGSSAIYRVELPAEVYETVARYDLGDVRVFNQDGERVPFAIQRQEQKKILKTAWFDLPVFPLRGNVEKLAADQSLDLSLAEDGKILELHYRGNGAKLNQDQNQYLLDLSGISQPVDALEVIISHSNEEGYLKKVKLESSNDLNYWSPLVDGATITELSYGTHSLKQNQINLPERDIKYIRFSWLDDHEGLRISNIRALLKTAHHENHYRWSSVTATRAEDNENIYQFDLGGYFPVEQINVTLPDDNTLIDAIVRSRHDQDEKWRTQYAGLFYRLNLKGTHLEGEPISVRLSRHRYWQLEVKSSDSIGTAMPELHFAWQPNYLYFLARGKGPYLLAYGNASAERPEKPVHILMNVLGSDREQELVQQASIGEPTILKGESALVPVKHFPWREVFLWVILLSGVLVVGMMSYKLMRQMSQP